MTGRELLKLFAVETDISAAKDLLRVEKLHLACYLNSSQYLTLAMFEMMAKRIKVRTQESNDPNPDVVVE